MKSAVSFGIIIVLSGAAAGARAQQAADIVTSAGAVVLTPTEHPRLPRELSQYWMTPERGRARTAVPTLRP